MYSITFLIQAALFISQVRILTMKDQKYNKKDQQCDENSGDKEIICRHSSSSVTHEP